MIKDINKIPQQVYDQFDKAKPEFLIVGISIDRSGAYQFISYHQPSEEDMLLTLAQPNLVRFRAFKVGEVHESEGILRGKAKEFTARKKEEYQRSEYERLKKIYESVNP